MREERAPGPWVDPGTNATVRQASDARLRLSCGAPRDLLAGVPAPATTTVLHYVGYDSDRGGIVSVVRALAAAGRFTCVLGVNRGFVQARVPALPVREFSSVAGERINLVQWVRARAVAREVRQWLAEDRGRIFHGHSRAGLLVALWLHRAGERRVVASVHCYGRQRWFYRWAARRMGENLFWLSPAMKRHYGLGDRTWVQCLPGCVPPARGFRQQMIDERREPDGGVRLGGVGALVRWKRWHLVLEALAALPADQRARLQFHQIGAPDGSADSRRYAAELTALTASKGLTGTVTWLGEQPGAGAFLRTIDCLVVPSDREPFSVAMLEALQAGVPVLAADSGGACDLIQPPENGWLFPSGDAVGLARALGHLLEPAERARVVIRPEGQVRFESPAVAAAWADVYQTLLQPWQNG